MADYSPLGAPCPANSFPCNLDVILAIIPGLAAGGTGLAMAILLTRKVMKSLGCFGLRCFFFLVAHGIYFL